MEQNVLVICDLNNKGTYTASEELVKMAKEKNSKQYINVSYTDYGGTFFDKVLISYLKENYPDNIIVEGSAFNGENAFIFGDIVPELLEKTNDYILAFDNIEEHYFLMEDKQRDDLIDDLKKSGIIENSDRADMLADEYLKENSHPETFGVDYNEDELKRYIQENI